MSIHALVGGCLPWCIRAGPFVLQVEVCSSVQVRGGGKCLIVVSRQESNRHLLGIKDQYKKQLHSTLLQIEVHKEASEEQTGELERWKSETTYLLVNGRFLCTVVVADLLVAAPSHDALYDLPVLLNSGKILVPSRPVPGLPATLLPVCGVVRGVGGSLPATRV